MRHNKADRDFEVEAAGQSGDTQGIPDAAEADSESVEELLEEQENSRRTTCRRNISTTGEYSVREAGRSETRIEVAPDRGTDRNGGAIECQQGAEQTTCLAGK
jgi:hypothetical protein